MIEQAAQIRVGFELIGARGLHQAVETGTGLWAAAGFMDTLIRWKMEPEVAHGYAKGLYERVQG